MYIMYIMIYIYIMIMIYMYIMIYGETGTTPLHITIEKRMIGYWLQIIMGSSSKLNYQIYKYVLHLDMQNI